MKKFISDVKTVGIDIWHGFVWCVEVVFALGELLGKFVVRVIKKVEAAGEWLGSYRPEPKTTVLRGSKLRKAIENCVGEG